MNILEKIIENKRKEVEKKKKRYSIKNFNLTNSLRNSIFKDALRNNKKISIIAEIKRKSPSSGIIKKNLSVLKTAKFYKDNGAKCISVLTDNKFFGGKDSDIKKIKKIGLPVLRKEFIIDEFQIYETKYIQADAILLITKILNIVTLKKFVKLANELGLTTIVEVTNEKQLEIAIESSPKIIGINNRNLENFEIELNRSFRLAELIPKKFIKISESGIKYREQILSLEKAGFDAVLIGTSLVASSNPGKKLSKLTGDNNV